MGRGMAERLKRQAGTAANGHGQALLPRQECPYHLQTDMSPTRKFPNPPLLFLLCLLAGLAGRFMHPWALGLAGPLRWALALLVLVPAAGLETWALQTFRRRGTSPDPDGIASALLVSGPFRISRNPLYLCRCANLLWIGLLLDSAWLLAMVPVLAMLLDLLVIRGEEARLQAQFGEAYAAYRQRVRRWL